MSTIVRWLLAANPSLEVTVSGLASDAGPAAAFWLKEPRKLTLKVEN